MKLNVQNGNRRTTVPSTRVNITGNPTSVVVSTQAVPCKAGSVRTQVGHLTLFGGGMYFVSRRAGPSASLELVDWLVVQGMFVLAN